MRLWTIILTLLTQTKKCGCQQYTNLTEDDIGMPIDKYLKIINQCAQDSRKHSSSKYSPHNEG